MFQTVKCPQCGQAHIEYPNPKLRVTCTACKKRFHPFSHLKVASAAKPSNKSEVTNEPASPVVKELTPSERIFEELQTFYKLYAKFQNGQAWTMAGEATLQEMKAQMSVLYNIVFERLELGFPQLKEDLQSTFVFLPLSPLPQKLSSILAFIYIKATELGQESSIMLFAESEHWLFSRDAIEFYKPELSKLINI